MTPYRQFYPHTATRGTFRRQLKPQQPMSQNAILRKMSLKV